MNTYQSGWSTGAFGLDGYHYTTTKSEAIRLAQYHADKEYSYIVPLKVGTNPRYSLEPNWDEIEYITGGL